MITRNRRLTVAAMLLPAAAVFTRPDERPDFTVHVHNIPMAAFARAYLVETSDHVVVIDAGPPGEFDAIRNLADSIGKPISSVLLTHAHIDHYGGVSSLVEPAPPIAAGIGVARHLKEYDEVNHARFGASAPKRGAPDRIVGHGETIVVDGVAFTHYNLGPGESYSDSWWLVSSREQRAAFIGDVAMYGLPPFIQSGHSRDWINSLNILKEAIPNGTPIYIGHEVDPRPYRDHSILDWEIDRLVDFRTSVADITKGTRLLTNQEIDVVVAVLNEQAPENLKQFDFLITTTANIVAAELISEKQKDELERMLRAMFANSGEHR